MQVQPQPTIWYSFHSKVKNNQKKGSDLQPAEQGDPIGLTD